MDEQLLEVGIDQLRPGPFQPRSIFKSAPMQELAVSIKANGVVQPIVVRAVRGEPQQYEILAGERRWRAAQLAGLHVVPVVLRSVSDEQAIALSLIENIQREPLRPIEEARAIQRLIEEFAYTHEQAATSIGWTRDQVTHCLRLLQLPNDIQQAVDENDRVSRGHARALVGLSASQQREVMGHILKSGWSVRAVENYARRRRAGPAKANGPVDPDVRRLEEEVSATLGAPVRISYAKDGSGELAIRFHSLEELDGILDHLRS